MIKKTLKKLISKSGLTTYGMGLIQSKAYRILNNNTTAALSEKDLTPIEWALLGLLYDNTDGLHHIEIAEKLGVEAPFVTVMIDKLEKKQLVKVESSKKDRRAKCVVLNAKGQENVEKLETHLREQSRFLLNNLSIGDLLTYQKVLKTIVKNYENKQNN